MTMGTIRQWHSVLSILIAPSVLFFALTGGMQIFDLHEAHGNYRPFVFVEELGELHKDQVFALGKHGAGAATENAAAGAGSTQAPDAAGDDRGFATAVLKWFFAFVALGLATSTFLGLWIGLSNARRWRLHASLLAAGAAFPIIVVNL